jgi:beta-lactamase regulating signal transducer with metallopeptidase domain
MIATGTDFIPMSHAWLAALFRASWQGAIAVGLVWCLCRWASRIPPSVRCWLWRLVLVKFLLVAFWPGSIDLPWLPVDGLVGGRPWQETRQPSASSGSYSSPGDVPIRAEHDTTADSALPAAARTGRITFGGVLWVIWASGVAVVAAVLIVRTRAARRWRKRCTLVKDAEILTVCEGLADELGVYQPPVLFVSEACESPVVFGALRTSVVLPARLLDRADSKRLRLILRHELAHIRRGDLLWNWMATAVWGLFFFHPLVWIALRELRLNQELACDAYAIKSRDTSPADYGTLLVELADRAKAPANMLVTVGVVESFEFLKRRLRAMKDPGFRSPWAMPLSVCLLSLAIVGLAPWRLVARPLAATAERLPGASATEARDIADDGAASGAADRSGRPLATVSVGGFNVAVDNLRWAEREMSWVESGFPLEANRASDGNAVGGSSGTSGSGSGGGAGFLSGGSSSSFSGGLRGTPNLVVDLRVSRPGNGQRQLLCTVVGEVRAQDDRGHPIDAPVLPAHLRMELRGVEYPRGSGCTPVHLNVRDKKARSIKSLVGNLLVMDMRVQTTAFEGSDLRKGSARQLDGGTIRLDEVQHTQDGIGVNVSFTMHGRKTAAENARDYSTMHNRLRVVLEDSEQRMHEPESFITGGGGGNSFTFSNNDQDPGHEFRAESYAMSQSLVFAPLTPGVTVERIVCSMTEPMGEAQRIAFEFKDLPLP